MYRNLTITALLGVTAIILGAFGAHALKETLSVEAMKSFETGVRYQIYHVITLLFVNTFDGFSSKIKNIVSVFFILGILFFSGSIYVIYLFNVPSKTIWFITPLGGFLFILGWSVLCYNFVKKSY